MERVISVESRHEATIRSKCMQNCTSAVSRAVIASLDVFINLSLTESFLNCLKCLPIGISVELTDLFKLLHEDVKRIAIAEMNGRQFNGIQSPFDDKYSCMLKAGNNIKHINFMGLTLDEKIGRVYEYYANGWISYEESKKFFSLIKTERDILGIMSSEGEAVKPTLNIHVNGEDNAKCQS